MTDVPLFVSSCSSCVDGVASIPSWVAADAVTLVAAASFASFSANDNTTKDSTETQAGQKMFEINIIFARIIL